MSDPKCPFCGEPRTRQCTTYDVFRCGTEGPDINGEYDTGRICDMHTYQRLLNANAEEIASLTARLAAAEARNECPLCGLTPGAISTCFCEECVGELQVKLAAAEAERDALADTCVEAADQISTLRGLLREVALLPPGTVCPICDKSRIFYRIKAALEGKP